MKLIHLNLDRPRIVYGLPDTPSYWTVGENRELVEDGFGSVVHKSELVEYTVAAWAECEKYIQALAALQKERRQLWQNLKLLSQSG